ncbi:MAG: Short-chain dehydrogenase [Tardiphaga sp.]|uniref:SDR family oxidoreductase n=1 Tax=Tardiphaga sp. TaxID=1926292 RepID=UPI002634CFFD|nr:SDR family oxidoreductase [Tardiphaga sp.]MDB5505210.1 Short-chain dehydrogenase [Tardiphaga sp.]
MTIVSPVLIVGAASDIGRAIAAEYAKAGASLILAARDVRRLEDDAKDLYYRYKAEAQLVECDILDAAQREALVGNMTEVPGTVISVVGLLGDETIAWSSPAAANQIMQVNYVAPSLLLGAFANRMAKMPGACIIGISSVAGDRGRKKNYTYGSAKAGFTAFLSGLRNRFGSSELHVLTVKPGFAATRMTQGMALPSFLTASPEQVARAILEAHRRRKNVVYVLGVWRWIMLIIRAIPEQTFKSMDI